jgi:hypothetical protein
MLEIAIALSVGFALGYVFASGFPADGVKRRDSAVPFNYQYDASRRLSQAGFLDLPLYEQTDHAAVL